MMLFAFADEAQVTKGFAGVGVGVGVGVGAGVGVGVGVGVGFCAAGAAAGVALTALDSALVPWLLTARSLIW